MAKKNSASKSKSLNSHSSNGLLIFSVILIISFVGGFVIYRSFAGSKTIRYNANQFETLPNWSADAAQPHFGTDGSGAKAITVLNMKDNSYYSFNLQLFPGNYRVCFYGKRIYGNNPDFDIDIRNNRIIRDYPGGGWLYQENYNGSICSNISVFSEDFSSGRQIYARIKSESGSLSYMNALTITPR